MRPGDGEKINKYRKVKIEHNGTKYEAKLKLHLESPAWKAKKLFIKIVRDKFINKSEN